MLVSIFFYLDYLNIIKLLAGLFIHEYFFYFYINCDELFNIFFEDDIFNHISNYNKYKYKFLDYYYNVYVHFYSFYKFFKKILLLLNFSILKIYIIFINDTAFFKINNFLFILFLKFKKRFHRLYRFFNKKYFKFNKKYKYYYRFGEIGYLKFFFFLSLLLFFTLM